MTKSRMTLLPLVVLLATPGMMRGAQSVTAERAMEVYRQTFQPVRQIDCPPVVGEDIVVCGRPKDVADPNRLPLPIEREPGEVVYHAGEPARGFGGDTCLSRCASEVGMDLNMAIKLVKGMAV